MFFIFCVNLIICLHPTIDRTLLNSYDKYSNVSLDEFDNCDYVTLVTDVTKNDLVVIQLNVRGLCSKCTQLIDLIDTKIHSKEPDLI